jgi:pimeloyl-ACP methyl ester carboxylesterase
MDTITKSFVNTAQCRFFYVESGEGQAVLLLHGASSTHNEWSRLAPWLARDNRVIAPDLPGQGQTARPREGYGRTTQARAVVEFMKALGEERLAVVGHGLGGFLAIELAAAFPYTVSKLALISPVVGGFDGGARLLTGDEALAERQLYGDGSKEAALRGSEHFLHEPDLRRWYAESLREYGPDGDPKAVADMLVDAGRAPDGLLLQSFRCPTLVIRPEADPTFSHARAERVAGLIPLGRMVEIPGSGHFVTLEHPERLAEVLLPFLRAR